MTVAVKHRCINFLRKRQEDTVSIEENPGVASSLSDDEPEDESSTEKKLQAALATLPPKCRNIFLLAKLKGMKYKEIAEQLAVSERQ